MSMWEKLCKEAIRRHESQTYASLGAAVWATTPIAQELAFGLNTDQLLEILETRPDFLTIEPRQLREVELHNLQYAPEDVDITPASLLQFTVWNALETMLENRVEVPHE